MEDSAYTPELCNVHSRIAHKNILCGVKTHKDATGGDGGRSVTLSWQLSGPSDNVTSEKKLLRVLWANADVTVLTDKENMVHGT